MASLGHNDLTQWGHVMQYGITNFSYWFEWHVDGLVQDCSNSSALSMELLQSCTKQ